MAGWLVGCMIGWMVGWLEGGLLNAISGYVVPSSIIARFARDFDQRGGYTQFCFPPFNWQQLLTADAKRFFGVDKKGFGVRLMQIHGSVADRLQRDDVLLSIDGKEVGHDGKAGNCMDTAACTA